MLCSGFALLVGAGPAQAQVETNFSAGGGLRMGYTTASCTLTTAGALRYNSASGGSIDFCNGSVWNNVIYSATFDSLVDAATDYITDFNMFIGQTAGQAVLSGSQYNLFLGYGAGDALTTGSDNMAVGKNALGAATLGTENTAIGFEALSGNNYLTGTTTRTGTVAVGYRAGIATGDNSVVVGSQAAGAPTGSGGNDNVLVGKDAMYLRRGNENVAIGRSSLSGTGINSHGNVALGAYTLTGSSGGSVLTQNVAIGYEAGKDMVTGSNNTLIGFQAGSNITTGTNNIIIGPSLAAPSATTNNYLSIGDMLYGALDTKRVGINTASPLYALHVIGDIAYTGVAYDVSDQRRKEQITPLTAESAALQALVPVSFVMKDDALKKTEYGFIAQDVAEVYPALVKTANDADRSLSLNYIGLIAPMVKSIQERQAKIAENQKKIDALRARMTKP